MSLSTLRFELAFRLDALHATPLIDSKNVLGLGPPALDRTPRTQETARARTWRFILPAASDLLPPDSSALVPWAAPRSAVVGICSCGHVEDAALRLVVRREGDRVVWEPSNDADTVPARWTFDLVQYLDALDDVARRVLEQESRAARLARAVRDECESLPGLPVMTPGGRPTMVLRAWADAGDQLGVLQCLPSWSTVRCRPGESDEAVLQRVRDGGWDHDG